MKKLFFKAIPFGIAFLFSATSQAQVSSQITDFYLGNTVTGDTLYFWVGIGEGHQYLLNQTNIGSTSIVYKCKKTNITMIGGAYTNFCIYHNNDPGDPQSQCYTPPVMTSGNFSTDPGEFNTLLADFVAGSIVGTSIVNYKFYDTANPNDSACITLIYNVTPVGIAENLVDALGQPYPNPSNGVFQIPVAAGHMNSSIIVTNALGEIVSAQVITNETKLTIDAALWSTGIYFVTMYSENGALISRRKLIRE